MSVDERALGELIEESQDLQSEAMSTTRQALGDMVEVGRERRARGEIDPDRATQFNQDRRRLLRTSLLASGAFASGIFGPGVLSLMASPAFAQASEDVMILQTAASLENLAVATYTKALGLPFIGGSSANQVVKAFSQTTMKQHAEHAKAFNAAVRNLGGKEQTQPDPVLLETVQNALPTLKGPENVVDLALDLEQTATENYVAGIAALTDPMGRKTMASIVGVESQHAATLRAVKALLGSPRTARLIALPPNPASDLPEAAGSVGFPDTFMRTGKKRPNSEGAVK